MTNITAALILMCSNPVNYNKFKHSDMTEHLAFVKCFNEMNMCYKWNSSLEYCKVLLKGL